MDLKNIKELGDLRGKRILLRLDLNVPIVDKKVHNDYRLKKSVPTIEYLRDAGAKIVIISHIWEEGPLSLKPVHALFREKYKFDMRFIDDCLSREAVDASNALPEGGILLLENLRKHPGEMENSEDFAKELSRLGEIYVNDAFAVLHREHASVVTLPKYLPTYAGLLVEQEIEHLSKVSNPPKPFLFILGGAKFETKMPIVKKYLNIADYVFAGGALANDFFEAQGYDYSGSLTSDEDYGEEEMLQNEKLILPRDVTGRNKDGIFVKHPSEVSGEDRVLDIGPSTIIQLKELINKSKFVLWNGPIGDYKKGFRDGTLDLAEAIANAPVESIVGGGDTFAVISKLGLEERFTFMSTGGGAMLEFLQAGSLPGLEPLIKN